MRNGTPANGPFGRSVSCLRAWLSMERHMALVLGFARTDCSRAHFRSSSGETAPDATCSESAVASQQMYSENFMVALLVGAPMVTLTQFPCRSEVRIFGGWAVWNGLPETHFWRRGRPY